MGCRRQGYASPMIFSEAAENSFIVKIILNTAQKTYISVEKSSGINCLPHFDVLLMQKIIIPKCGLCVQILFEATVSGK